MEEHHPVGKGRDASFTVLTPANLHRALSDAQHDHPTVTSSRNPVELLRELIWFLIDAFEQSAEWLTQRLRDLDDLIAYLAHRLGSEWPEDFRKWREAARPASS